MLIDPVLAPDFPPWTPRKVGADRRESRYTIAALPPQGNKKVGPPQVKTGRFPLWHAAAPRARAGVWIRGRRLPPSPDEPSAPSNAGRPTADFPFIEYREAGAAPVSPAATTRS